MNMPFFVPDFIPNNYPNVDSMQNKNIEDLESRINNIEKEIDKLKKKVNSLENKNNDNYSYTYQANSYNMM